MDLTSLGDPAQISLVIATIVGLAALYVPDNTPSRTAILRSLSVALGAVLVPLAALSAPGAHLTLNALLVNVQSGVLLGAATTLTVKAAHVAAAKLPSVSVSPPASTEGAPTP